jgi:uncharacterized protein YecT (DUF1311 family)
MAANSSERDDVSAPIVGFRSYADDTPRGGPFDPELDDGFEPLADEPRFQSADVDWFDPLDDELTMDAPMAPAQRRGDPRFAAGAGLLGAVVLAAAVGTGIFLTQRAPTGGAGARLPSLRGEAAPPSGAAAPQHLQIVGAASPEAAAPPAPRLDVARLAPRPSPPAAAGPAHVATLAPKPRWSSAAPIAPEPSPVPPPPIPAPAMTLATAPPVEDAAPRPAPILAPARRAGLPPLDCRYAQSLSQQIVCDDPGLVAAHQRMNRAYAAALAAGVPEDELRSEQDDWLRQREGAGRRSKQAVENAYHQRIGELEALADPGPP